MKKLDKILIYHRVKHKKGDFSKSDWMHLRSDLIDFIEQLTLTDIHQRIELVCEHKFGDSYEQMGGGLTLHECEKCGIVQTCD